MAKSVRLVLLLSLAAVMVGSCKLGGCIPPKRRRWQGLPLSPHLSSCRTAAHVTYTAFSSIVCRSAWLVCRAPDAAGWLRWAAWAVGLDLVLQRTDAAPRPAALHVPACYCMHYRLGVRKEHVNLTIVLPSCPHPGGLSHWPFAWPCCCTLPSAVANRISARRNPPKSAEAHTVAK